MYSGNYTDSYSVDLCDLNTVNKIQEKISISPNPSDGKFVFLSPTKIDQIEIDISNEVSFDDIVSDLKIKPIKINNFKFSDNKNEIEKKIFELKDISNDIFEIGDNYILYTIVNIEKKKPDLKDDQTKKEIVELISQKNKFEYNRELLDRIRNNKFSDSDFLKMSENNVQSTKLNSIKDNNKFLSTVL